MKKLLFLVLLAITNIAKSQEKPFSPEITIGMMVDLMAIHNFGQPELFPTTYSLSPSLNTATKWSHHHVMFDVTNDAICTINGVFITKNKRTDIYSYYSYSVKKKEIYLSIGLEKQLSLNFAEGSKEEMDFIFFVEAGTDLNGNQSATFGFVLHPQIKIWEGKHGKRKQEKAKRIFEKLKNKNSPKKPITAT